MIQPILPHQSRKPIGKSPVSRLGTVAPRFGNQVPPEKNSQLNAQFLKAAERGDIKTLRALLATGKINVDAQDKDGVPAIHWVAANQQTEALKLLIDHKANVNLADKDGWTALHLVTDYGSPDEMRTLLAAGANPNAKNNDGDTPLHLAMWHGDDESDAIVKMLLEAGADSTLKNNDGETPHDVGKRMYGDQDTLILLPQNAPIHVRVASWLARMMRYLADRL